MPAILLVPGWSDRKRVLRPLEKFLLSEGWPRSHVRALGFRDRFGSNVEHAHEIADAVERLATDSGAGRIAVIAHSMGGLALRWYLSRLDGARRVETAVFLATPHRGTWLAWLAWGAGGRDMRPDSVFLRQLNASPVPATVRTYCIRTSLELRIVPPRSALLAGAPSCMVHAPTHPGLLRSPKVFVALRDLLLEPVA